MHRHRDLHTSTRTSTVDLTPEAVRAVVASGRRGPQWYVDAPPLLVRGALDRLVGGGPLQRPPGRHLLEAGDRAGFWTVVRSAPDELLLEAAVRAPGSVLLRTSMEPEGPGRTQVRQTVSFAPSGVLGRVYLVVDLPARESVIELTHRHLLAALRAAAA
jgi:hypothetical protein